MCCAVHVYKLIAAIPHLHERGGKGAASSKGQFLSWPGSWGFLVGALGIH